MNLINLNTRPYKKVCVLGHDAYFAVLLPLFKTAYCSPHKFSYLSLRFLATQHEYSFHPINLFTRWK